MALLSDIMEGMVTLVRELNPFAREPEISDGSVTVAGVEIPAEIARQLRERGIPLENYTAGELREALIGFSKDGRVFDDPHATGFMDSLHYSPDEQRDDAGEERVFWRNAVKTKAPQTELSHCKRLEQEREEEVLSAKHKHAG